MVAEVEAVLKLGTGTVGQAPPGSTFWKAFIIKRILMIANIFLTAYYVPIMNILCEVSQKPIFMPISQIREVQYLAQSHVSIK